jgi:hypothetical protein
MWTNNKIHNLHLKTQDVLGHMVPKAPDEGLLPPLSKRAFKHRVSIYADDVVLFLRLAAEDIEITHSQFSQKKPSSSSPASPRGATRADSATAESLHSRHHPPLAPVLPRPRPPSPWQGEWWSIPLVDQVPIESV